MKSDEILKTCKEIIVDKDNLLKGEMDDKYANFKVYHFRLFEACVENLPGTIGNIEDMLERRDKLEEAKTKIEEIAIHTEIGQKLSEEYLEDKFPELKHLTPAQKRENYQKMLKQNRTWEAEQKKKQNQNQ